MKALIVADLHYSLRQFDWLLRVAPDYDLVIIAGDLLDIAGHCDLDVQIVVVTKYLARIARQTRLVTCSGNHDGDTRNEADEFIAEWLQDELRDPQLVLIARDELAVARSIRHMSRNRGGSGVPSGVESAFLSQSPNFAELS